MRTILSLALALFLGAGFSMTLTGCKPAEKKTETKTETKTESSSSKATTPPMEAEKK